MKHTKLTTYAFLIFMILFSSWAFAQTGTISGYVKSEVDSLPIMNAWVLVFNADNPFMIKQFPTQTDSTGFFLVDSLTAGQYYVYVRVDSFIAEFNGDAHSLLEVQPIILGPNQAVTTDFYLALGGKISGFVTTIDGDPIPNAIVTATPLNFFPIPGWQDSLFGPQYEAAVTDENGFYKINTLATGEYRISATVTNVMPPVIQYWENTDNFDEATPVEVTAGEEVPYSIDFQFDIEVGTGAIAGTVTDVDGNPLADIWVVAIEPLAMDSVYHNFPGWPSLAKTDENGEYKITGLFPGEYYVSATRWDWFNFQTIWYDGADTYEDATPVTVEDTTVYGIDFVFDAAQKPGSISGQVVSDVDGSPIAQAYVEAIRYDSSYYGPTVRPRPTMFAFTDEQGKYKLDLLLEGEYIVLVHKNGTTEFYDDTQDFEQATPVIVTGGEETENINFSIPPIPESGSSISGLVTDDSTGAPIPHAFVTVFPAYDSTQIGSFEGDFTLFDFYATIADSEGNYILGGIPEGEYIIACWAPEYIVEFYNDKLDPWEADHITLDGTEELTGIDFALTPGWGFDFFDLPEGDANALCTISGHISGSDGENVNDAFVYVYDENGDVRASEKTGADGHYTLTGLPPGDYYVKASRLPYQSEYYSEQSNDATELSEATLITVGEDGNWDATDKNIELTATETSTGVEKEMGSSTPRDFSLSQNYPNPFNPTTSIGYALPQASYVTLQIFNLRGELVRTLVNGMQQARYHQVTWDGKNDLGQQVAAGVYIYRLKAGNYTKTMQLLLLK